MSFKKIVLKCFLVFFMLPVFAKTHIIAAENNYGVIAKMIGGDEVDVTSILNNPNQDPHLSQVSIQHHMLLSDLTAKDFIILNGGGYDPWMSPLLKNTSAKIINVAQLNSLPDGVNPHLWYDLSNIDRLAQELAKQLSYNEPSKKTLFDHNLQVFLHRSSRIKNKIQSVRSSTHGIVVVATEPVANYLSDQLGLIMQGLRFQQNIMNDVEPSASDRAEILQMIRQHKVALLIYNKQVTNPVTAEIQLAAVKEHIPIIGVNELLPTDTVDFLSAYQNTVTQFQQALEVKHAEKN